ncbi:MAG: hypothetical protein HYV52_00275 [Parcubacteria group bacterium]|nr:hypothetical protein [Parcubacteria group bacterium]
MKKQNNKNSDRFNKNGIRILDKDYEFKERVAGSEKKSEKSLKEYILDKAQKAELDVQRMFYMPILITDFCSSCCWRYSKILNFKKYEWGIYCSSCKTVWYNNFPIH